MFCLRSPNALDPPITLIRLSRRDNARTHARWRV